MCTHATLSQCQAKQQIMCPKRNSTPYTHAHAHTHTHTHTHTRAHTPLTQTLTHTHTHTPPSLSLSLSLSHTHTSAVQCREFPNGGTLAGPFLPSYFQNLSAGQKRKTCPLLKMHELVRRIPKTQLHCELITHPIHRLELHFHQPKGVSCAIRR